MPEKHSDAARTVIVPVARPDTARLMIQMALAMLHPQEGRVIALTVAMGDSEQTNKLIAAIQPVVEDFQQQGAPVEMATEISTSISRGILDATREKAADILILGVHKPDRRQVKLGTVVENVMHTSPCNVVIYRLSESAGYRRVVIPVDYAEMTSAALQMGVLLARQQNLPLRLYIQRDYVFQSANEEALKTILQAMPADQVERVYTAGHDPALRILEETNEDDLLVLAFSQKDEFERQMDGETANKLLNRAVGPVILVSQLRRRQNLAGVVERQLQRWNPALTRIEQTELIWQAQKLAEPNIDYFMMILFAAGLASLGLMSNSPAVIIGAMLVAPLMQPLSAAAAGLIAGQMELVRRAMVTLLQGVIFALLLAILAGRLIPLEAPTTEMLARGNPSLLDAGVALVSGLVAAYATARKGIPAALAGVAIAAALMPPLCTVGLGIALQIPRLAGGAALLFLTNILSIIVAAAAIFFWMGLRPIRQGAPTRLTGFWGGVMLILLGIVTVIVFSLSRSAVSQQDITHELTGAFAPAQVVRVEIDSAEPLHVLITLRSPAPITPEQVLAAQTALSNRLNRPVQLEALVQQVIEPGEAPPPAAEITPEATDTP